MLNAGGGQRLNFEILRWLGEAERVSAWVPEKDGCKTTFFTAMFFHKHKAGDTAGRLKNKSAAALAAIAASTKLSAGWALWVMVFIPYWV